MASQNKANNIFSGFIYQIISIQTIFVSYSQETTQFSMSGSFFQAG